jgi:hypothetical protein
MQQLRRATAIVTGFIALAFRTEAAFRAVVKTVQDAASH